MDIYTDLNNDSGVVGFEIGSDFIVVWFEGTARSYTYSYARAGQMHVDRMKVLARAGDGLNAYINFNVKYKYDI